MIHSNWSLRGFEIFTRMLIASTFVIRTDALHLTAADLVIGISTQRDILS